MKQRQRVQAVIIQNNKVLFGAGMMKGKDYRHFFIGGGVEEGDTLEEAIIRELREEANVDGAIIFKFANEYKENHHTFLLDIGNQSTSLGYDPEDEEINKDKHLRTLQKLEFISFSEYNKFTSIDIMYFKILLEECNRRCYLPEWYEELKKLVERDDHIAE